MEDLEKDIPNIKKKIKNVLKSVFKAKKLLIVIIIILVLIFISAMDYFKVINDGEEWQTNDNDEKRGSTRYESNVSPTVYDDGSGGGLKVDKNALIKDALIDRKFSEDKISGMTDEEIIDVLKINKKLKKKTKVTSLDELTEAEILWCMDDVYSDYLKKPEELEKLLNAEIITQYPKMGDGATDANGKKKLDGIIQFERHQQNGKSKTLKFIKAETFNSYVSNGDDKALDYFTLDEEQNAVIAYKNTTTETLESNDSKMVLSDYAPDLSESDKGSDGNYKKTTVSIGTEKINYKNATQKYVMPFKYLWSLLVIGRDRNFVLELADLVENSKITISIYDNVTTTTDTDVFTYKKQNRTDTYVEVTPSTTYGVKNVPTKGYWWPDNRETPTIGIKKDPDVETEDTDYKITHTVVNKINRVEFALTKADVWIVDYSQEYTYQEAQVTSNESNTKDMDPKETEYVLQEEGSGNSKDNALLLNCDHAKEMIKITTDYIEKHKPTSSRAQTMGTDSNSRVPSASGNTKKPNSSSGSKSTNSVFSGVLSGENINDNVTLTPNNGGSSTSGGTSSTTETEQPLQVTATYVKVDRYQRKIERKESTTNTVSEQKYVSKTPVSNPKDDKDADKDNFVKILRKGKHRDAKDYLTDDATSWLWKIMSQTCPNMVDLTKYLFYKVTGKNYGIKEYDFSEFDSGSLNTIGGLTSSNVLFDYLASWENTTVWEYVNGKVGYSSYLSKYITQDKSLYICYVDSNKATRNFGYGVCHTGNNGATYWHTQEYAEEGINISSGQYDAIGTSTISVSIVDAVKEKLLIGYQEAVKNQLSNAGILDQITQPQLDSLTCIMYQYGNIGNFVEVYKTYGNTDALISNAKSKSGKTYFNSNVESNGRSQANWKLFHEGIYVAGTGETLDANSYATGGDLLNVATNLWKKVCTSGQFTSYGGVGSIPPTGHSIDCSGYVTWVLYELGYKEEFYYQHNTSAFLNTNWNAKYGWEEISVGTNENPYNKLQPGDIFVRQEGKTHHVNIVVKLDGGKLYAYDCGNYKNWANCSGDPIDRSYFLTTKARGKIIRVKK